MSLKAFLRRGKQAAVLGCGPAGLFAAHGLIEAGWDVVVISKKRRSEMFGAQYLHKPIKGLSDILAVRSIEYKLLGTPEEYRQKVYGNRPVTVSPERLAAEHDAWDIRAAYYAAWFRYEERILNIERIAPELVHEWESQFPLIVSTIPAPVLCEKPEFHSFASANVWAIGDAPERGIFAPVKTDPFQVLLNGEPDVGWYRASNVFDYRTVEWPGRRKPPLEGVAQVVKPISTNCDCFPDVRRAGRYGAWNKSALVHTAYELGKRL